MALGVEWGQVVNGIADIEHIPADVLMAFSTRRAEIEERMAIRNQHSPKAAMIAALDTRRTKQIDPGVTELRARWIERAEELGFDQAQLRDAIGRHEATPISKEMQRSTEDRLRGADGLTAHDSSFDRNEILMAWCDSLPAGAPIEQIEDLAESLIDRMETAPLHNIAPGKGPVIRDASGRTISALPPQERWTTFELLEIERRALATANALLGVERAMCPDDAVLAALRSTPSALSEEQATAVIQMTRSGNGVDVLTAPAGAGKTFAFAAARDAWERSGHRVIGAAHTGVAADELSMAAGIPSTTIARLLIAIDRGEPGGLDDRTVLVIDEAGTAAPATSPDSSARSKARVPRRCWSVTRNSSRRSQPADCSPLSRSVYRCSSYVTTVANSTSGRSRRCASCVTATRPTRSTPTSGTIGSPSGTTPTTPRCSCWGTGGRRPCGATMRSCSPADVPTWPS